MKFGQLMEYNINIFFEQSYTKCGEESFPRLFFGAQILKKKKKKKNFQTAKVRYQ